VRAMLKIFVATTAVVLTAAGPAFAQAPRPGGDDQVRARQQISMMNVILERAVNNGADNVLRQVSSVMPDRPMLSGAPRVDGFRLHGYGVFFHVQVPGLIPPLMWPLRQIVQDTENRAAMAALQRMRTTVETLQGREREQLQQTIRDLEATLGARGRGAPRGVTAATLVAGRPDAPAVDPAVIDDPQAAYTQEVKEALITAMLENNQGLSLGPDEWLTIAAHDAAPRNPLLPGDTVDLSTWMIRVKGSDLAALRTGTITREEARQRVEVHEN
jgi:hypothetical protein